MNKLTIRFSQSSTDFFFNRNFGELKKIVDPAAAVMITDENVYKKHREKFKGWNCIVLKAGEEFKIQSTADAIIEQLIAMNSGRQTFLIGVGGGVVTDITGYVASVFMRGLRFGFVPSSLLAMVDAAIGGKNGIDVGVYKNMVGTFNQPTFIFYDFSLLTSLPDNEWSNGFAEIIKHAFIRDAGMFRELEKRSPGDYRKNKSALVKLIRRNALLKAGVVKKDEFEKNERRLLNFGHTLGHALENQYELSHGQAISIGMTFAAHLSEKLTGLKEPDRLTGLLSKYGLPTYASFNKKKVYEVLKMDKKKERKDMNFVLLENIGKGLVKKISLKDLQGFLNKLI
jgi:3-dehydroquinate synthase